MVWVSSRCGISETKGMEGLGRIQGNRLHPGSFRFE